VTQVTSDNGTTVNADRTTPPLQSVTFPFFLFPGPNTAAARVNQMGIYNQFQPSIIVTSASGSGQMRVFADTVTADTSGRVIQKTRLTDLNLRPVNIVTGLAFDPLNPLGGFESLMNSPAFAPIDPMYRGEVLTAVSAFLFDGTAVTSRGQYVFGAGKNQNQPLRGPEVKIYDNMGIQSNGTPFQANTGVGNQEPSFPIDDFQAFTGTLFANGIGGIAFGFGPDNSGNSAQGPNTGFDFLFHGGLPMPGIDTIILPVKGATSVSDPIYVPPAPQP